MNDIKDSIRAFVVENLLFGDGEKLQDDTSFLEEGVIDSTGILELIAFIEETFRVSVDDDELIPENLDSIDNVTVYLQSKLAKAKTPALVG